MKKSELLKGFIIITVCFSFCGCSHSFTEDLPVDIEKVPTEENTEEKEEFNIISNDPEDVLSELLFRGCDTSSWKGIYYLNNIDESIGNESDGFSTYEHIIERTIGSEIDNNITCINDNVIYLEGYDLDYWSEWEYYDGTTLYGYYYGYYEQEDISLTLEDIMSYPLLVLEASLEKFTVYSGLVSLLESILDVSFSGYVETSNLGNTNICIRIDENYAESYGEVAIQGVDYAENIISYNSDNQIVELNYTAGDLYSYTDTDYFYKSEQTLFIKEQNEKVDKPDWLNEYID